MSSVVKRGIFVLVLVSVAAVGAFAQMSVGGGLYLTRDSGGGGEGVYMSFPNGQGGYMTGLVNVSMPYLGFGAFAFLDAGPIEASIGLARANGDFKVEVSGLGGGSGDLKGTALDLGLMLKYPIPMSQQIQLFPMLGAVYRKVLSAEVDGEKDNNPGDYSAIWFKGGVGVDYLLASRLFIRAEGLYGIRLKNQFEKDMDDAGGDTKLAHGFDIKIAVGYLF